MIRFLIPIFILAFTLTVLTGCNANKYDTYTSCERADGQYQIIISISHDSSEPSNLADPHEYAKLCTEFVGAPDVHINQPKP